MLGIALGAAAFLIVFWVDAASIRNAQWAKPLLWLATVALFLWGVALAFHDPRGLWLPAWLRVLGWILTALFGALLVYSLFIEIPFHSAYVAKGQPAQLVSRGTYALCRHPGVLWLGGLLLSLFLADGSRWLLAGAVVWTGLDVLYVLLQDRIYFPRMFGDEYGRYRQRTPMLIPTPTSARECMRTIFRKGFTRETRS